MTDRRKRRGPEPLDYLALAFGLLALSSYFLGPVALWAGLSGVAGVAIAVILRRALSGAPRRRAPSVPPTAGS